MKLTKNLFYTKEKPQLKDLLNGFSKQPLKYLIILFIIVITVAKLNLMGAGLLSFPDEFRYMAAERVLTDISKLDIKDACEAIFSTKSKPGDVLLSTIPNAVQQFTGYLSNIYCYDSSNSYPLFIFNFIVYCLILTVHYKFSKYLLKDTLLALISVLLYSSLTSSYMYLRHVLAYDTSLLIFYWVIYKIIKYTEKEENLTFKKSVLLGICAFFGYLVYPGYFPLFFLSASLLFFNNLNKQNFLRRIYHSSYYALGGIYCLILFEAMAMLGGVSYISDAMHASTIVTQGSAQESFTFIIKYFFEVEGLMGIILTICLPLFCFIILYQLKIKAFKQNSHIILVGIILFTLYLTYASVGYFFNNLILMGRSIHQYYPFICIFSVFALNTLLVKLTKKNEGVLFILSVVFALNFGTNFIHYCGISYPRDIYWELGKTTNLNDVKSVCEYTNGWSVNPGEVEYFRYLEKHPPLIPQNTAASSAPVIITNGCFYYPVNDIALYQEFTPDNSYTLVQTSPHYLNFKAYQYEGPDINERAIIDKINFQIRIFSKTGI